MHALFDSNFISKESHFSRSVDQNPKGMAIIVCDLYCASQPKRANRITVENKQQANERTTTEPRIDTTRGHDDDTTALIAAAAELQG